MNKIEIAKELIKRIKAGRLKLNQIAEDIKKYIKEMIINITIKKVALIFTKYVLPILIAIAAIFCLLVLINWAVTGVLADFFGNMVTGIKFFFCGRSGEVNADQVAYTKQELEKAGVEFDEIGYLGEQYLVDEKIEIKIPGFTSSDGTYTTGDKIKIDLDSDEIPADETATMALIEYKLFLDKKMKEENIEAEVILYRYTIEEETDSEGNIKKMIKKKRNSESETELKAKLKSYNGQKVKIKDVKAEDIGDEEFLEEAKYYTVNVTDNTGTYTAVTEDQDYYKEQQRIKNDSIVWYLTKCYEAQAYTYKNQNNFTLDELLTRNADERDKGGITITFATDCGNPFTWDCADSEMCELHQAMEIPGAIGTEQQSFYNWMSVCGQATFGVLVDETDGKFYAKLNDTEGAAYNTDITSYVYDYAMPWNYPFAFHENSLAPDIGYLVSRLAQKYHRLELKIYALAPKLENSYTGEYHDESPEPTLTAGSRIETVRTHQSTWYKNIDTQYTEVYTEKTRLGYVYNLDKYEVDYVDDTTKPILDADGNVTGYEQKRVETKTTTDKKYYSTTALSGKRLGKDGWDGAEDYYLTTTVNNEVYQLIPELVQSSHTETLNDPGIDDMDSIMESIPKYSYDTTAKRIKLDNEEDVKYYYTANKYMVKNDGTFKHKFLDGTEKTYYIKGKTMLKTEEVAQAIVDSVYNIYEDDLEVNTNLNNEIDLAKGEDLTDDELNELRTSDYDGEKDYTLAKPIVKELIAYFWDMGALDPENENLKNVAQANILTTLTGDFNVWPVEQDTSEIGNFTYDASTNTATISCGVDSKVVAPVSGTVSMVKTEADGTYTVFIDKPLGELKEDGTEKIQTTIIGNLKSVDVSNGQAVTSSQQIGTANGPITYQVLEDGAPQDIQQELTNMGIAAKSTFKWPVRHQDAFINSHFGWRTLRGEPNYHWGVDFNLKGASIGGQPIYASRDGTVIKVSNTVSTEKGGSGWGNYVKIDHGDNTYTLYAHMKPNSITVKEGDKVTSNTQIGNVGTTGNATGYHLHFEIYVGGSVYKTNNVDPEPYLTGQARVGNAVEYSTSTSADFTEMLHSFEGDGSYEGANNTPTHYQVYIDNEGYRTVGYGVALDFNKEAFKKRGIDTTTLKKGDYVERTIADEIKDEEINSKKKEILSILKKEGITDLKDYQIEALVSRCYQQGTAGGLSTLPKYERNGRSFAEAYKEFGNTESLGTEFMLLPKSGDGRDTRRKAEWKLFHTGQYSTQSDYE